MSTSTAALKASHKWSLPLPPRAGGTFEYSQIAKCGAAFISHVFDRPALFVASCATGEVIDQPDLPKVLRAESTSTMSILATRFGWFGTLPAIGWKNTILFWRTIEGQWRRLAECQGACFTAHEQRAFVVDGSRIISAEASRTGRVKDLPIKRELRPTEHPVLIGNRLFMMAQLDGNERPALVTIDAESGRIEGDRPMIGGLDEVPAVESDYRVIKAGGAAIKIMVFDAKGRAIGEFDLSWGAVGRVGAVIGNTLWLPMGGECGLNSEPWRLDAFALPKGKRVASVPLSIKDCSWTARLPSGRLAVGGVGTDVVDLKSKRSYKATGLSKWGNAAVAGIGESVIAVHTREIACYELE